MGSRTRRYMRVRGFWSSNPTASRVWMSTPREQSRRPLPVPRSHRLRTSLHCPPRRGDGAPARDPRRYGHVGKSQSGRSSRGHRSAGLADLGSSPAVREPTCGIRRSQIRCSARARSVATPPASRRPTAPAVDATSRLWSAHPPMQPRKWRFPSRARAIRPSCSRRTSSRTTGRRASDAPRAEDYHDTWTPSVAGSPHPGAPPAPPGGHSHRTCHAAGRRSCQATPVARPPAGP